MGLSSLEAVEDMTWKEYHLRRFGYLRAELKEWERVRFTSYHSLVATGAINPKKTTMQKFMPFDSDPKPKRVSDAGKEAFEKAQEQYLKEKNGS